MKVEPRYWLSILRLRALLFSFVAILTLTIAVFLSMNLPVRYTSSADLLVEKPRIPTDLAASTVRADAGEQLALIQQRLLTRQNLLDLADQLALYPPSQNPDWVVRDLRDRISVRLQGGSGQVTVMTVTAEAEDGQIAADLVNELVKQFLDADSALRSGVAEETLSFFSAERERLADELDILGSKILDFQNANADALPDSLDYRLDRQSMLQERLSAQQRDLSRLREQRARLEELETRSGASAEIAGLDQTPDQSELIGLEAELDRKRAILSEQNPQIGILRLRIERLQRRIAGQSGPAEVESETEPAPVNIVEVQLADLSARIEEGETRAQALEAEIESLQDSIQRTPANEIALSGLERELDNIQSQYNRTVERLSVAATGERIEILSKGQRVVLLEEAIAPLRPSTPSPELVVAAGMVGAIALGLLAVVLAEFMRSYYRRPSEITSRLGITPLATIPYFETPGERIGRAGTRIVLLVLILIAVPLGLLAVDTYLMPVERVADVLLRRLNI